MNAAEACVDAFASGPRRPGEAVLAWVPARCGEEGAAILTDRRLCFVGQGADGEVLAEISVIRDALSYLPPTGDRFRVSFRTDEAQLDFEVEDSEAQAGFGNFLGNIADLREAQRHLDEAGLARDLVTPPGDGETEGLPAVYQLMRLKELGNRGLIGEVEIPFARAEMLERFRAGG